MLFLPGVWSEEPSDNPPAGPAHLGIADVWEEPSEGAGDGAADKESTGDPPLQISHILLLLLHPFSLCELCIFVFFFHLFCMLLNLRCLV